MSNPFTNPGPLPPMNIPEPPEEEKVGRLVDAPDEYPGLDPKIRAVMTPTELAAWRKRREEDNG